MPNSSQSAANEPWVSQSATYAMQILENARETGRPVVLLLGAGISVDSGFPLASQLKDYLVQVDQLVRAEGYSSVQQYIEETRWPSRHDLRVDLMLKLKCNNFQDSMAEAERRTTQSAMLAEMRRNTPLLSASLNEIFGQLDDDSWSQDEFIRLYSPVRSLAESLGKRSPRNIAYRSLLYFLCDRNQTTIDACLDHFIRDRQPTTTHQFVYFLSQLLRSKVIFTTNFDPLLEVAFSGEGLIPRIYEMQGEGTIPSWQLLLPHPLSIVKLHGGTHGKQTGFDLDDPLSPSARATFDELYGKLEEQAKAPPLTLVIGYSGSDRRVMDIVGSQLRAWHTKEDHNPRQPRVLWVSRDQYPPQLLRSSVMTHPDVLQQGSAATRSEDFPAHLVRYRDGQLFLLESLQFLLKRFPIARRHYQAISFVPHSVSGKDRQAQQQDEHTTDWRMALFTGLHQTGVSTRLVALADCLERSCDYRTIWLDLTEVTGVSALMDMISERMTKLDCRLQPIRRPMLLHGMLNEPAIDVGPQQSRANDDSVAVSEMSEITLAVQWLRHSLRRGKYLLALDSLDEFPSGHPALVSDADDSTCDRKQRDLLTRIVIELIKFPEYLGDSRIAFALSRSPKDEAFAELVSAFVSESERRKVIRLFEMPQKDASQSGKEGDNEDVHQSESAKGETAKCFKYFNELCAHSARHKITYAVNSSSGKTPPAENTVIEPRDYRWAVVLLACSSRRLRSRVYLVRAVTDIVQRFSPVCTSGKQSKLKFERAEGSHAWNQSSECVQNTLKPARGDEMMFDRDIELAIDVLDGVKRAPQSWGSPSGNLLDHGKRWIYRTEGGLYWMHQHTRDGLYRGLLEPQNWQGSEQEMESVSHELFSVLADTHNAAAVYYFDELFEQSRDARAFLEYVFHRVATIRLARKSGKYYCAIVWAERLMVAHIRERQTLLTRSRLPVLLKQLVQLELELRELYKNVLTWQYPDPPPVAEQETPAVADPAASKVTEADTQTVSEVVTPPAKTARTPRGGSRRSRYDISQLQSKLAIFEADILLATGHPHSAFTVCHYYLKEKLDTQVSLYGSRNRAGKKTVSTKGNATNTFTLSPTCFRWRTSGMKSPEEFEFFRVLQRLGRDASYSLHNPLLSVVSLSAIDWVEKVPHAVDSVSNIRFNRVKFCFDVYQSIERHESDFDIVDWRGGLIRRRLELALLWHPEAWINSTWAYLHEAKKNENSARSHQSIRERSGHRTESTSEDCFRFLACVSDGAKKLRESKVTKMYDTLCISTSSPLHRDKESRLRHECHRLCLWARIDAAEYFESVFGKIIHLNPDVQGLELNSGEMRWTYIMQNIANAESILARRESPADLQSMAITRLTLSELYLRRAEYRYGVYRCDKENKEEFLAFSIMDLDTAMSTLSTVEALLNVGRGENRWRFYYMWCLARCHLLRAAHKSRMARRSALEHMTLAARNLVGAMSNVGYWTDRYDVLIWWWDVWKRQAQRFWPHDDMALHAYRKEMDARIGLRWCAEDRVLRRDDAFRLYKNQKK